jgi:tRNA threonylcarbamoyladenosine biosynthesis protein TsaE
MENKITINNLEELTTFAKKFLTKLNLVTSEKEKATVIALSGDLGAGKTTLVQQLAKELGIIEIVTSPTFTIMKKYSADENQVFEHLVHMDAYRIDSLDELSPLRLAEILATPKMLVCIEWAEKINPILPKDTVYLSLSTVGEEGREITIVGLVDSV